MSTEPDFGEFMKHRREVAAAYSNGDARLLDAILVRQGPASFFPPSGGHVHGADEVGIRYDVDARAFSTGNHGHLEVLDSGSSGDLAYWTGIQHFEGSIGGQPMKLQIRITELFRREAGSWKLFHRHADPMAEPKG